MLNSKSFLAVDFGAVNIKLAEFQLNEAGGLRLQQYGFRSLGQEGLQETTREPALQKAFQELLSEKSYSSKSVNVCAPGFHTFSKFVKLPPVDTSKVTQIIQYEAQQNVPFPLEEVVWDYQILGATPTGELEVLLVAIKSDVVEGLFRSSETAGMRLQLVDVSPAALCNAFRYNYGDLEGCTMLLDIGAKTSTLLFFEKGNVYSRGINIGANAITVDFSKESKLSFADAEKLKIEEGFVSLGGAYEEPDNANQAAISKIARQVLTRLHIQVNQTIQFYRGQQGGSAPERLFLSGGASVMGYTAQFFSEKLNIPVDYFNPLRNIELAPEINREELAKVAHSMGEVVGLGLRNLAHCPIELNLMPKSSLKRQQFSQKKPYLAAALFCLILVVFAAGLFYDNVAKKKTEAYDKLQPKVNLLKGNLQRLNAEMKNLETAKRELNQYTIWVEDRFYWANVLTGLRESCLAVEIKKEKEINTPIGVWVERLLPAMPPKTLVGAVIVVGPGGPGGAEPAGGPPDNPQGRPPPPRDQGDRGGGRDGGRGRGGFQGRGGGGPGGGSGHTNEITLIVLHCRGVNLTTPERPDANTKVAQALVEELKANKVLFLEEGTEQVGKQEEEGNTFTFQIKAKLKRPFLL